MRNITISLPESLAAWARREAAKSGMSVSRFVSEMLQRSMGEDRGYETAMRAWQSGRPRHLSALGERIPGRDEVHDRDLR
jgi:hypothetical protein